jgi:hypothetical protein
VKEAQVYLKEGMLYAAPYSKTVEGLWVIDAGVFTADASDDAAVANLVIQALAKSRQGVEHPTTWDGLDKELLSAMGLKSFKSVAKAAKGLGLVADEQAIQYIPTKADIGRGGFAHLPKKKHHSTYQPGEIVSALKQAFADCE